MANEKSPRKKKLNRAQRQTRAYQIIFVIISIVILLSLLLSLVR